MTDQPAELRRQILEHYPVGSEWYDRSQDTVVRVILHFEPRGIVTRACGEMYSVAAAKNVPGFLGKYGYDILLDGRLIVPRDGGYYHEYQTELEEIGKAFKQLLAEHGLAGETIWG